MTNFNGDRISNIGDAIYDKDGVNLRSLKKILSDTYVTGFTYDNNNTFTIKQNNDQPDLTATINDLSVNNFSASTIFSGGTLLETIIQNFISESQNYKTEIITGSTANINLLNNYYYGVNYNGQVDLTLPDPQGFDGVNLIIKDESGNAGTYRIRLTPTSGFIDNYNYVDMNLNYIALHLISRNGNWWII
jgi:hypothetical protein